MRHEIVKVKRDNNTVHSKGCASWETPILEYIFEEGNVTPTGEFTKVTDGEYPDAVAEFQRLTSVYGVDAESKLPYVAVVYGNAGVGIRALRKAIEAEMQAEDEADKVALKSAKPATLKPAKRLRKLSAADAALTS